MQLRAEMYNIFNHSNQYITGLNLDVSSLISPYIQTEKGGVDGYPGQPNDERRNVQFGLKLTFNSFRGNTRCPQAGGGRQWPPPFFP